MKKILFGIFAHPDDEAFGPSATFLREVVAGAELHLICATAGESGANPDGVADLGATRKKEWQAAAQAMGAVSATMLDFADGSLCNNTYHTLADSIEERIRQACSGDEPAELCLTTFNTDGLTGHLDHIAVSYITTHVFYRLKAKPPACITIKELAYYCLSKNQAPEARLDYFVYWPAGHDTPYITRQVDVSELVAQKFAIMRLHKSQRADCEAAISQGAAFHHTDSFRVLT